MNARPTPDELEFGRFRIQTALRQLLVDDEPARLGARAFDVLQALVSRRERVVGKDELLELVWPGLVVEENNLQVHISALRKVLGPQAIATIPGRGYQFILSASSVTKGSGTAPAPPGRRAPGNAKNEPAALTSPRGRIGRSMSLSRDPNNLPPQLSSFIGRESEIAAIGALLGRTPILSLTGSGGCGKTRLSLEVAAASLARFPDGAWFVELAALADPGLVPQMVAKALRVKEVPGKPITRTLVEHLKHKRLVLVLDNCESRFWLAACARPRLGIRR